MKKISTLFVKDHDLERVLNQVNKGHEWVLAGEGIPTIKKDGTAFAIINGKPYLRYDAKVDKRYMQFIGTPELTMDMFRKPPEGFIPCMDKPDEKSGHFPGWIPVLFESPDHKWAVEAWNNLPESERTDGTYELIGPKLQENPHGLTKHELYRHGSEIADLTDFTFEGIRDYLESHVIEGIVFHHKSGDGRMCKIRRIDYGFIWNNSDKKVRSKKKK